MWKSCDFYLNRKDNRVQVKLIVNDIEVDNRMRMKRRQFTRQI